MKYILQLCLFLALVQLPLGAAGANSIAFPSGWQKIKNASQPAEYKGISATFTRHIPHVSIQGKEGSFAQWEYEKDPVTYLVFNVYTQPSCIGIEAAFSKIPAILTDLDATVDSAGTKSWSNIHAKWIACTLSSGSKGYLVVFGNSSHTAVGLFVSEHMTSDMIAGYNALLKTFQFP